MCARQWGAFSVHSSGPLVSVFVPVYNAARYVEEAVESALAQTHTNLEIVISDDASTDGTPDVLQRLAKRDSRIKLFLQERNLGATKNCNFLLERCTGDYVCFFAGDDVLKPDCVAAALHYAEDDPMIAIVFHKVGRVDSESNVLPDSSGSALTHFGQIDDFLKNGIYCSLNGMLVSRRFLGDRRFDASLPMASDFSLVWSVLDQPGARFLFLAKELGFWRKHGASMSMAKGLDCTREAMLENYALTTRYPAYARHALARTEGQALTLVDAHGARMLRALVQAMFSWPVYMLDRVLRRFFGSSSVWRLRLALLKRL